LVLIQKETKQRIAVLFKSNNFCSRAIHTGEGKASGMKRRKTWRSAEAAAAARACESMLPISQRLFYDPYAKYFLSFKYAAFRVLDRLNRIPFLDHLVGRYAKVAHKSILWYMDRLYPGGYGFVTVRTRFFDDQIETCIEAGIDQLVILGAGFDARAYRLNTVKEKVTVFEVDQPVTMKRKMDVVKKVLGRLPDHVVYVFINFEKDNLADRLLESGYDPHVKSLFIWEAVAGYLSPGAVDEVLRFVADNPGGGNSIIFDYPDISFINEPDQSEESATLHRYHAEIGEPPQFGIDPKRIHAFLSERGFFTVRSVSVKSLGSVYFEPKNREIKISPFFHLIHAAVKIPSKPEQEDS
jgi:methyltransferase (TIGR00027 family)